MHMDNKPVTYSIDLLPALIDLGARDSIANNKRINNLMPDAIKLFLDAMNESTPIKNRLYKNMKLTKLVAYQNTIKSETTKIPYAEIDEYTDYHFEIEDGTISEKFIKTGIKIIDRFIPNNHLKQYQHYFKPTGTFGDLCFLHSTGPVGFKINKNKKEHLNICYGSSNTKLRKAFNDISCNVVIVDIGADSNVVLQEDFKSNTGTKMYNIVYLIRDGARLDIERIFEPSMTANIVESRFVQFPNSTLNIRSSGPGSEYIQEINSFDVYNKCLTNVVGRYECVNNYATNIVSKIHHMGPDSISRVDVKSSVDNNAHTSFLGEIVVDKDAINVDANLINKNLQLSPTSTVITEPQLDINTKDIMCSHGCTVSNIDEEKLYFLESRGIPKDEARSFIKECFLK